MRHLTRNIVIEGGWGKAGRETNLPIRPHIHECNCGCNFFSMHGTRASATCPPKAKRQTVAKRVSRSTPFQQRADYLVLTFSCCGSRAGVRCVLVLPFAAFSRCCSWCLSLAPLAVSSGRPPFLCKPYAATGSNLVEERASLSGSHPRAAVIQEPAVFLDDCQLLIQIAVAFPVANPVAFPVANSTSFGLCSENWFSLRARV